MLANCFGATEFDEPVSKPEPKVEPTPQAEPVASTLPLGWIALTALGLLVVAIGASVTVTFLTQDTLKSQLNKRTKITLREATTIRTLSALINGTVVNITGPTGAEGAIGIQGARGATGVGATGAQGPQGPKGDTGSGPQGVQGFKGAKGDTGPQGLAVVGAQGIQGATGGQGPVGPVGLRGFQGLQGLQGFQGPQGIQGNTGSLASCGTSCQSWVTGAWSTTTTASPAIDYEIRHNDTSEAALTIGRLTGNVGLNVADPTAALHIVRNTSTANNPLVADQFQLGERNDTILRLGFYDVTTPAAASYGLVQSSGVLALNPSDDRRVLVGNSVALAVNDSKLEVMGSMRVNGTLFVADATVSASITTTTMNVTNTLTTTNLLTTALDQSAIVTSLANVSAPTATISGILTTQSLATQTLQMASGSLNVATLAAPSVTASTATITNISTTTVSATTVSAAIVTASSLSVTGTTGNVHAAGALAAPLFATFNIDSIDAGALYSYTRIGTIVSVYLSFSYVTSAAASEHIIAVTLPFDHVSVKPLGSVVCGLNTNSVSACLVTIITVSGARTYTLYCQCPGAAAGARNIYWNIATSYVTSQ